MAHNLGQPCTIFVLQLQPPHPRRAHHPPPQLQLYTCVVRLESSASLFQERLKIFPIQFPKTHKVAPIIISKRTLRVYSRGDRPRRFWPPNQQCAPCGVVGCSVGINPIVTSDITLVWWDTRERILAEGNCRAAGLGQYPIVTPVRKSLKVEVRYR